MVDRVLAEFGVTHPDQVIPLGNMGGFSGSFIWKVIANGSTFCLKRWPSGVPSDRVQWIHNVLTFVVANGCDTIVTPIRSPKGETVYVGDEHVWEINQWANGVANFRAAPNRQKIESAISTLARFHQAAARYQFNFQVSPNLKQIRSTFEQWPRLIKSIDRHFESNNPYCDSLDWQRFKTNSPAIATELNRILATYSEVPLPVHPVIRDVRAEHFFFNDNSVVGLIDFGALQIDNVACDLARMLGSMTNDSQEIDRCLNSYSDIRLLSKVERDLVSILNRAGILIGIANWLTWLFVEQRSFDSERDVSVRLSQLFQRFH